MALLAIPLAASTIATPFITSPFGSSAYAPVAVGHTKWFADRLSSTNSFFGSVTPVRQNSSDSRPVELGLRFKPRVNGTVTAIRFYKGLANLGTHVGKLWDASGRLLGSVTFAGESAKGWQQATLAEGVHLTAGASYVVSYFAPGGRYAADKRYFRTSRTVQYLYAFADSEGHNGVYKYGGGFPTASQYATNYYVDVIFKPDAGDQVTGTTAPPTTAATTTTAAPTTTAATTAIPPATTPPATSPPTTAAPTTNPPTTKPPTTSPSTTQAPSGGAGVPNSSSCVFSQTATVAFCDSFNQATPDTAGRSGDLDAAIWGVSRLGTSVNASQGYLNRFAPATLTGCGLTVLARAPRDVRVCSGRAIAAVNDIDPNIGGGQAVVAMYPKQPFDIAGRTGTVVFDISADAEGGHAAWPEFWWTDQPVPAPSVVSGISSIARNALGVSFALPCANNQVGVDIIKVARSYMSANQSFTNGACITKGSATGALNHFEVKISQSRVEVWGTDAGSSVLKLMATVDNANLTMTRGLIWVENVHYNACKFNTQCDHEFAFDNIGFDGPAPYRDLSFDVPDNTSPDGLGWQVDAATTAVQTVPVYRLQTPTAGLVTFNWYPQEQAVPSFRLNGGPWHDTAWPFSTVTYEWRTIGVSVPVSEIHDGVNTIEFKYPQGATVVANVNAILIAGSPVS
jgi:hypothetical protein